MKASSIGDLLSKLLSPARPNTEELSPEGTAGDPPDVLAPLARIARATDTLPSDLLGFSALAAADPATFQDLAVLVHEKLEGIASELEGLKAGLEPYIASYLKSQTARLGIAEDAKGLKINLTGYVPIEGWINVGAPPTHVVTNLLWPLPFPDASVRLCYFALAIEHFHLSDVPGILQEIHRVLEPGGAVRIVTQDTEKMCKAYASGDREFFEAQRRHWPWVERYDTPLDVILAWSGTDRPPGQFFEHKYGYDVEKLSILLRRAGFATIEPTSYMKSRFSELCIDTNSHDAGFARGDDYFALFVDAQKGPA